MSISKSIYIYMDLYIIWWSWAAGRIRVGWMVLYFYFCCYSINENKVNNTRSFSHTREYRILFVLHRKYFYISVGWFGIRCKLVSTSVKYNQQQQQQYILIFKKRKYPSLYWLIYTSKIPKHNTSYRDVSFFILNVYFAAALLLLSSLSIYHVFSFVYI